MFRYLAAFAILMAGPSSVAAQSTTGLTSIQIETFAYDSMISWSERDMRPSGVEEVAAVEGMIFLDIRAVFDVPWDDDLSRLSISARDIFLLLDDGTEIQSCCSYPYFGMMHLSAQNASLSRPRDFPDADADLYWHSIFLVPEGTKTARLELRNDEGLPGFAGVVNVPDTTTEIAAASYADFSVTDTDLFRALVTEDGRDTERVTMRMMAPPGRVFADLEVRIAGIVGNEFEAEPRFHWHTYDFRLVGPDGTTFPSIGERFSRKILDWQFNGVNPGDDATRRMIWLVPEGTTSATLMFGSTPVESVTLGGGVQDEG